MIGRLRRGVENLTQVFYVGFYLWIDIIGEAGLPVVVLDDAFVDLVGALFLDNDLFFGVDFL